MMMQAIRGSSSPRMMGMRALVLASVVFVVCISQVTCHGTVSTPGVRSIMLESAAKSLGAKPVELLLKDAYPSLVRPGLVRLFSELQSLVSGLSLKCLQYRSHLYLEVEMVADMIMEKLRIELFGDRPMQSRSWRALRDKFRNYLFEWWFTTPFDPVDALQAGVWQSMLKLAADDVPSVFGGTPEYERLKGLLLDKSTALINSWTEDVQKKLIDQLQAQREQGSNRSNRSSIKKIDEQRSNRSNTSSVKTIDRRSHSPSRTSKKGREGIKELSQRERR